MSRCPDLLSLFDRWRQLTELEGEGIRRADWNKVAACQEAKELLQRQISEVETRLRQQTGLTESDRAALDRLVRERGERLLALELRNREWLSAQKEATRLERAELEKSSRNLHQVQKAYGVGSVPLWHSYS